MIPESSKPPAPVGRSRVILVALAASLLVLIVVGGVVLNRRMTGSARGRSGSSADTEVVTPDRDAHVQRVTGGPARVLRDDARRSGAVTGGASATQSPDGVRRDPAAPAPGTPTTVPVAAPPPVIFPPPVAIPYPGKERPGGHDNDREEENEVEFNPGIR